VVCARKRKRVTAGGRSDTERAPPCLGTIFISPTGEKAWTIQKEWTCRATLRRVRRRWCWRANSDTAVKLGRNWQGWFVTVVDQHGHQVDSVPIADMPDE